MADLEILADFAHVANRERAAALSEPILRNADYCIELDHGIQTEDLSGSRLLAIGAAYIVGSTVQYGFTVARTAPPLQTASTFIEEYSRVIRPKHELQDKIGLIRPQSREAQNGQLARRAERVKQLTQEAGLITIVAFSLHQLEDTQAFAAGLLVAKNVVDVLPLEGREKLLKMLDVPSANQRFQAWTRSISDSQEERDRVTQDMLANNEISRRTAVIDACAWMPAVSKARIEASQESRVGNFFANTGTKQRKLLKQERQQLRTE